LNKEEAVPNEGALGGEKRASLRSWLSTPVSRRGFLKLGLGATLVASYPILIERYLIFTNYYRIPVPRLPQAFAGLRVVQIADVHYGLLVPLALVRHVVETANQIPRDIIVCTGDYVHERHSTTQIDEVWPILAELNAPLGVLSVLGNHDHWANTAHSDAWLKKTGQDLRHKTRAIERNGERLWFAGAGDFWEDHRSIDGLLSEIPENECRVVLAHNPDSADTKFSLPVDLMLSGHTHGGQVQLPLLGALVLPVSNKTYSSGLVRSPRGTRVFISKGIGWAILPIRFNCAPEIAVLELVPDSA
jgi:uncharacterized protein